MPFAEDRDLLGEFGSGGHDEVFGEAVRSPTARRDLYRSAGTYRASVGCGAL